MKNSFIKAVCAYLGATALPVMAGHYVYTLPEFDGPLLTAGDPYPQPSLLVGNLNYTIPLGETIVSADISGQWGNSGNGSSARNQLFLNGLLVADTAAAAQDPYYFFFVPWDHPFLPSEFAFLNTTPAAFDAVQTSEYELRLGVTTLTIDTQAVPEPSSFALAGLGAAALMVCRRRKGIQTGDSVSRT